MGIDQSLRCTGVVLLNNKDLITFDLIKTDKDDFQSKFHRMRNIAYTLTGFLRSYSPKIINIEGLPFGNNFSNVTRDLAALQGIIIATFIDVGFDTNIITPTELKKIATGSGNAKKEELINNLPKHVLDKFKEYGARKTTGLCDLADAYWLASYDKFE